MITTTLRAIREQEPSSDLLEKLIKNLNGMSEDEPLKFSTIVESNGIEDALWCLRSLPDEHLPAIRLLAADIAERVLHIYEEKFPDDKRPREAIKAARDFANGKIDKDQLKRAAYADADAAASYAAYAAAYADADADAAAYVTAYAKEKEEQAKLLIKYFG